MLFFAILLMTPSIVAHVDAFGCTLRSQEESTYRKEGDLLIGGIFPVNIQWQELTSPFHEQDQPITCSTLSIRAYGWVLALMFTINEINQEQWLLPNITLGFLIYDTCQSLMRTLQGTIRMLTGKEKPILNYQCGKQTPLTGIIGESRSTASLSIARLLGLYRYPQVSYFSSSPLLSDKLQFPSFFRTIPSDIVQALGLAQLVAHFGWTWVGIVSSEDDYGTLGSQLLKEELLKLGVCIAFHKAFPIIPLTMKMGFSLDVVKSSSASIILVLSPDHFLLPVMEELSRQNVTGKVWIATEAWSTSPSISNKKELQQMLRGTIGLTVKEGTMPGLKEFLLGLNPSTATGDHFVKLFWEQAFGCQWTTTKDSLTLGHVELNESTNICTGLEKLQQFKSQNSDEYDPRISYNIYNAVYAVAHALQDMRSCLPGNGPFISKTCGDITNIRPWQLLHYMKNVHFKNKAGEEMFFDSNGNPPAVYDIVNWQLQTNGEIIYVKVGSFDSRESPGKQLSISSSTMQWNLQENKVPHSVCSESCVPGYRKAPRKGQPFCCFDCIICSEGEISNQTDSFSCWPCPPNFWPSASRNECVPKRIEFLSYREVLGGLLAASGMLCFLLTLLILHVFYKYRDSAIVKANNRELTYLLLGTLALSFLCPLLFIGEPQKVPCLLRQPAFGITFVLCISCVLAKTIMVVIAFSATKPGSNMRRWLGPRVPMVIVFTSTFLQVLICAAWLMSCPPFPERDMKLKTGTISLVCNECSETALWCMLGYMGLLAGVSFLVAFLARKLPDSFNEAKWITFSMLVFISVWTSFVPGYLSTQGKYMVAVEALSIISSSAGIVVCIFIPKCYIILLRPDLNTREHLLAKKTNNNIK
ncbi:extracellular calcium-sensing receptor-like [Lissotriton helveticus]